MLPALRVKIGVGKDALPYHREQVAIASDFRELVRQFDQLSDELAAVRGHRTEFDPVTGEAKAMPIPAISEERRRACVIQQDDLLRRMRLLDGVEGEQRTAKAMAETVAMLKERERQVADGLEIDRRAQHQAREERLNKAAAARARMLRNDF
jgi:hypothetical protein